MKCGECKEEILRDENIDKTIAKCDECGMVLCPSCTKKIFKYGRVVPMCSGCGTDFLVD